MQDRKPAVLFTRNDSGDKIATDLSANISL